MSTLAEAGISLRETTDALLADGVQLFADAFRKLREAECLTRRRDSARMAAVNPAPHPRR